MKRMCFYIAGAIVAIIFLFLFFVTLKPQKVDMENEKLELLQQKFEEIELKVIDLTNPCGLKIVGDSAEIPWFEIELKLSEEAEKKLEDGNETIIVKAFFDGITNIDNIPKKYKRKYKDRIDYKGIFGGGLHLAQHSIELTDRRLAKFENIRFSKELYDLLDNKDILLLINVFSGRKSSMYNLLDFDILQGNMSEIQGKRFIISGKLIGE